MERKSKDEEPTVDIVLKEVSADHLELLQMAAKVTGKTVEEFALEAAVRAAESQELSVTQMRGLLGPSIIDFDPKPDQSE